MLSFEPNIVAFLCNWCSYAGADLTGTSRFQYPPNIKTLRVMCSGRVNPLMVIEAFRQGADGVIISGCHPGDCHYTQGNYFSRRRFILFRNFLEFLGIDPQRFFMSWVSASEGKRFAELMGEITEKIRSLGPMKNFTEEYS
jgi:F420-non-reducing hydrogenase iron-sulfur subunit